MPPPQWSRWRSRVVRGRSAGRWVWPCSRHERAPHRRVTPHGDGRSPHWLPRWPLPRRRWRRCRAGATGHSRWGWSARRRVQLPCGTGRWDWPDRAGHFSPSQRRSPPTWHPTGPCDGVPPTRSTPGWWPPSGGSAASPDRHGAHRPPEQRTPWAWCRLRSPGQHHKNRPGCWRVPFATPWHPMRRRRSSTTPAPRSIPASGRTLIPTRNRDSRCESSRPQPHDPRRSRPHRRQPAQRGPPPCRTR